jgi:hypothetical protein
MDLRIHGWARFKLSYATSLSLELVVNYFIDQWIVGWVDVREVLRITLCSKKTKK